MNGISACMKGQLVSSLSASDMRTQRKDALRSQEAGLLSLS